MTTERRNNSLSGNGSVEMNMHATIEEPVSKKRSDKHTTGLLLETMFSIRSVQSGYKKQFS
jgi:hypothetical protein